MFRGDGVRPSYAVSAGDLAIPDPEVRVARLPVWALSAVSLVLFAFLPALLTTRLMLQHGFGWDFRAFYDGARAYLHGASPYPHDSLAAIADKQKFVYPAPTALLFVPLALLPYAAALALWVVASVAAIALALLVLGVRDWRCFGALMLTLPAEHSLRLGTLSPLLLLLLALLWRYRDRVVTAAVLAAAVALSKVFLTPLLLWLVFTRRVRAAALATSLSLVLCLLAWFPLGESTIVSYPALLRTLAGYEQTFSYSLVSLLVGLGFASTTATGLAWAACAAVLCVAYARRSNDELVFRLTLAACFLICPIIWGHYFLLLAVPLALRWPRLGPAWVLAIWIKPDTLALNHVALFVGLALLVMAAQLGLLSPAGAWTWFGSTRTRPLFILAALTAVLLSTLSSAQAGYTRSATLTAVGRRQGANGVGSLRIDRSQHRLCWRIWTEALPSGAAVLAVEPRVHSGERFVLPTAIARAQTQGCIKLVGAERQILQGLIAMPTRYRLFVTVAGHAVIAGTLDAE